MNLKKLGPGLLFAGAAIGVSHLVQSTRSGADYGLGLLWALLLVNLIKYPFFQYGPRYAAATGKSLLDGYHSLGKPVLIAYFLLSILTMFTIQTAVTIVTAGLASHLFGITTNTAIWSVVIILICSVILLVGRYKLLDNLMKLVILTLTLSTVFAVYFAIHKNGLTSSQGIPLSLKQIIPEGITGVAFLIAFMGWMPAPLDISIWHSLWALEKKSKGDNTIKIALFDFNVGYIATVILGIGFVVLGAVIMYSSGESFSPKGGVFAQQLIAMYTSSLGGWATFIIGIAALTTMFSTTLTTLDASPRAMSQTSNLLGLPNLLSHYHMWLLLLVLGTACILLFFVNEMGFLVQLATILSFLTAPFYAICNYLVLRQNEVPKEAKLSPLMNLLSILSIFCLISFSIWYLSTFF